VKKEVQDLLKTIRRLKDRVESLAAKVKQSEAKESENKT
jgi:cell division septum initiation protein DivIVA